jgi:hypothetical protein
MYAFTSAQKQGAKIARSASTERLLRATAGKPVTSTKR